MTIEDLKKMTGSELKVIAYDTLTQIEGLQQSLKVINSLIAEKPLEKPEKDAKQTK